MKRSRKEGVAEVPHPFGSKLSIPNRGPGTSMRINLVKKWGRGREIE